MLVDPAQLASMTSTRRVRHSFAFIDLCGFCDFADGRGDDAAAEELATLRRSVREVAPLFNVRIEKWLGDGAMLVGADSESLAASVVAVGALHRRQGGLPVRAGIAEGEVLLLEGDDYVGRPVNLAARLCDLARPGEVVASRQGLRLPGWVRVQDKRNLEVRGFTKRVPVAALVARERAGREPWSLGSVVDGLAQPLRALLGSRPPEGAEPRATPD
jgi:class 3 adenylate cyclase